MKAELKMAEEMAKNQLKEVEEKREKQLKIEADKMKEKDGEIATAQKALESAQQELDELKKKKSRTEMPPPSLPPRRRGRGKASKKDAKEEKQEEADGEGMRSTKRRSLRSRMRQSWSYKRRTTSRRQRI